MRTTVTLDADVERQLRAAMRRQGKGFKETLNEALRRGLGAISGRAPPTRFAVEARPMRLRPGIDPAKLRDLDDDLEIQEFLRKTARLSAGRR